MVNNNFWNLKLATLLHDPPNKVLDLRAHEQEAFAAVEQILGTDAFEALFGFRDASTLSRRKLREKLRASPGAEKIKLADRIASAIDRTAYPEPVRLYSDAYVPQALIKHPFSGEEMRLPTVRTAYLDGGQFDQAKAHQAQVDALQRAETLLRDAALNTPLKRYLALWRALPYLAPDPEHRLLPSDTRMVDHTLWNHLDAASAVVGALPQPTFLHVSIGPVQSFIREARRTQDLWMGSYILAYLSWAAMRAVAEAYGPDAILYPALRGQPLVDRWLEELGIWEPLKAHIPELKRYDITIASLPNKFTALVPAEAVSAGLPEKVEKAVRDTWREIARAVKADFPAGARGGMWECIWKRQVEAEDFPEVYWSVLPWPDAERYPEDKGAEEALRIAQDWLGPRARFAKMLAVYRRAWPRGVHAGTMYGPMHELMAAALEARKLTRDFGQVEEDGEKCTVINGLSALRTAEHQTRDQVRAYWGEVQEALQGQGRFHELRPDGRERLSAIAAVKRFAQRSYFQDQLDIKIAFPSTSRVAAAPFCWDLMGQLEGDSTLQDVLEKHLDALQSLNYPPLSKEAARNGIPALGKRLDTLTGRAGRLAKRLLEYDADALYPTRLDPDVLVREGILQKDAPNFLQKRQQALKAQETCRALLKKVTNNAGIRPPSTYYAIVMMDGDRMGRWLAGEHERMPKMCEAMHPAVSPKFTEQHFMSYDDPQGKWQKKGLLELLQHLQAAGQSLGDHLADWDQILNTPRPLSTSLHASLSASLSNFALRCVRRVIEERHLGRVVYAGGDDLLAFLPLREVLPAVRELRALFAGAARVQDDDVEVHFGCSTGFLDFEEEGRKEWLLMPGPSITLSAGVAIVHHMHPLDGALAEARRAEEEAKEVYGRDALCIHLLRRSGEPRQVGAHWLVQGTDVLALAGQLQNWFGKAEEGLSSRLVYSLAREAYALKSLPETYESALKRLIERHREPRGPEAEPLAAELAALAQGLSGGLEELANWLMLIRFLAQEGGSV